MADHAAEAIVGIYRRHARAFAEQRARSLFERTWLARFVALLPEGASVLDIGCGFGEPIARHLIAQGIAVTGLDTSPTLLAMARAAFPGQTWIEGDMRQMELGRRFDGMLAWDSFFHLGQNDQRAMFPLFAEHARPGTALMFTSGTADGVALGSFEGETLFHASLGPAEYRALLASHGFVEVMHAAEDPACGGHTVWLARRASGSQ